MARFETMGTDLRLATASIAPDAISGQLAQLARSELARVIASGEGSPVYERFVNGRAGADESTVIAPGPILYLFSWWPEIIEFALEYLRERSPRKSGEYRNSWFVMVDGARVTDFSAVPVGATVTITNDRPYSRKIEVGHMRMSVPPGVADDGTRAILRQYGAVITAGDTQIQLPGGYVLRGHFRRGFRPQARRGLRRDTNAGAAMTYPAIVLRMKAA